MNIRIKGNDMPDTVLKEVGAIANSATLRLQDVKYDTTSQAVSFPLERFPILGKSFFLGTKHPDKSVRCLVTIRNVTECKIEDNKNCETIRIIFGLGFKGNEIFLCSAEEDRGKTCYTLTCKVSDIDVEIVDKEIAPTTP